jgi:hypothetical protein
LAEDSSTYRTGFEIPHVEVVITGYRGKHIASNLPSPKLEIIRKNNRGLGKKRKSWGKVRDIVLLRERA